MAAPGPTSFIPLKEIAAAVDEIWPDISGAIRPGQTPWGRPWANPRKVMAAVLYILVNDEPWSSVPQGYPSARTCQGRLRDWQAPGALTAAGRALGLEARLAAALEARAYASAPPPPGGTIRRA